MRRHWQYLKYVLRHKWFVFRAGLKLRVPLLALLLHDWDKFTPGMWLPYARTFRKPNGEGQYEPSDAFFHAWNGHEKRNKHHWQYWVLVKDSGELVPLPMPDRHRREMLADWIGAGRALGKPDTRAWYQANSRKIMLHPETRAWVERQLEVITDDLVEQLADVQHGIWSHWMRHLFGVAQENEDGSRTIPVDKVERWTRQMETPYSELPREEQYSDLEQAFKVVALLKQELFK